MGNRYCVDGHTFENEESDLAGDGQFPPFRVFDIDGQDYAPGTYQTRTEAQQEANRLNAIGRHPIIDARADRARKALNGGDYQNLEDLISDLLHLSDVEGHDFDLLLERGRDNYSSETGSGDDIEQDVRCHFEETGTL